MDLELQTDAMKYRNVKPSGEPRPKYFTTFLAIRDKNTGKTRLVEANETVLAPVIEYPKSTNPILLQEPQTNKTLAEKMQDSKNLIKSFGQSKGARLACRVQPARHTQLFQVLRSAGVNEGGLLPDGGEGPEGGWWGGSPSSG